MNVYESVKKVQAAQKELDQTLELIYTQQQELNQVLEALEKEVEKLVQTQNASEMAPADIEREKGYCTSLTHSFNLEFCFIFFHSDSFSSSLSVSCNLYFH
jgi:hypothetical protein